MRLRGRALLGAGLLLLGLGAVLFASRARFVERTVPVRATVAWTTRFHIGVTPEGERWSVSVRRPAFHLYRIGQPVSVRIDRAAAVPGRMRAAGRVDSFLGLWLLPLSATLAGALLIAGASLLPERVTLEIRPGP